MIFKHRETQKPALWITPYNANWRDQDDPNLYKITDWTDLPDSQPFYSQLGIPIEIWKGQGKKALWFYFLAFLKEDHRFVHDFWFFLLPSGFPDKIIG